MQYQGIELDFAQPFRRATMAELVQEATGMDVLAYEQQPELGGLEAARQAAVEMLHGRVSRLRTRAD